MLSLLIERGLGSGPLTKAIFDAQQNHTIRIMAAVCATLSIVSGLTAFYWFTRMKRKFRHTYDTTDTQQR